MEKIDILMATYNGEKYVTEQIESILNQDYKDINLIISDDCSKDNTREILKGYENKDSRITVFYQEENLGYVKNFEFLLKQVKSDYFMLSDQDDVWLPEKVSKSFEYLKEQNAELVFSDLTVVNEKLEEIHPSFNELMKYTKKALKYDDYRLQFLYNCVTGCTLLSKSKYLQNVLPVPDNSKYVIHDFWIPLIISFKGKIKYLNEPLIKYRQHGNNQVGAKMTGMGYKSLDEMRKHFIEVKLEIFDTYVKNDKEFPDELKEFSKKCLEYFKDIKEKKNINLKGWSIFHRLYKNDNLYFYLINFIIFNLPILGRIMFNVRLKLKGKKNG